MNFIFSEVLFTFVSIKTLTKSHISATSEAVNIYTFFSANWNRSDVQSDCRESLLYPRHLCHGVYSFRLDVCLFVRSYVRSLVRSFVRVFVRSLLSVTFVEFTSKFLVKVSLSEYISLTTHQKAFIFEPWVPERVSFYTMSFCPRVDAPGWG